MKNLWVTETGKDLIHCGIIFGPKGYRQLSYGPDMSLTNNPQTNLDNTFELRRTGERKKIPDPGMTMSGDQRELAWDRQVKWGVSRENCKVFVRPILLLVWHRLFRIWVFWLHRSYSLKVGLIPKGHARPSFFWYDNDKDLKARFVVTHLVWQRQRCYDVFWRDVAHMLRKRGSEVIHFSRRSIS